jgi:hypothetical protein
MEHEPTMSPRPRGSLRARLESGGFAVTAEIGPPRGADTGPIRRTAGALRGWVDAVNLGAGHPGRSPARLKRSGPARPGPAGRDAGAEGERIFAMTAG